MEYRPLDIGRLVQYGLTALFGTLIVAAFAIEAIDAAETLGWIAYPIVLGTGLVSFLLARVAYRTMAAGLTAGIERRRLDPEMDPVHSED